MWQMNELWRACADDAIIGKRVQKLPWSGNPVVDAICAATGQRGTVVAVRRWPLHPDAPVEGVTFAAEIAVQWDEGGPGAPGLFGHFVALGGVGLVP